MRLVYDLTLGRPGCALLQAALGGTDTMLFDFPSETWLVAPTPDMKTYELDDQQYQVAVRLTQLVMTGSEVHDAIAIIAAERGINNASDEENREADRDGES